MLLAALAGCTAVSRDAVVERRGDGVTRQYARPASDLFLASEQALDSLRTSPEWKEMAVTDRDPGRGILVAERDLRSVIPGLAVKDAFGVFVAPVTSASSDVTFVAMAADQVPGAAGTKAQSYATGQATFFPALDAALERLPETATTAPSEAPAAGAALAAPVQGREAAPARGASAAPSPADVPARLPAPSGGAGAARASPEPGNTVLDRAYALLRENPEWRPLARETAADGTEEIRIGGFARLTAGADKLTLHVRDQGGSATRAAKLALELAQAGLPVEVTADSTPNRRR